MTDLRAPAASPEPAGELRLDSQQVEQVRQFLYEYAATVDEQRFHDWVDLFTDEGVYSATTRELESTGMFLYLERGRDALLERAAYLSGYWRMARKHTLHGILNVRVISSTTTAMEVASGFALFRDDETGHSSLHACGTYRDRLVRHGESFKFCVHHVVVDADTQPSDLTDLL